MVTPDDVRWIAELAALEIPDAELEAWADELSGILAHFESIAEVRTDTEDTENTEDTEDTEGTELRVDGRGADPLSYPPGEAAPAFEAGFFTVPRLPSHVDGAEGGADGADEAAGPASGNGDGGPADG